MTSNIPSKQKFKRYHMGVLGGWIESTVDPGGCYMLAEDVLPEIERLTAYATRIHKELDESFAERDRLRAALEKAKRSHHYCEDSWYSCPKALGGCADESRGTDCDCGTDKFNAEIDALLAGAADETSAGRTALDTITVLSRYILDNCNYRRLSDHACAQCVPQGGMVQPGFVCAYHLAKEYVRATQNGEVAR